MGMTLYQMKEQMGTLATEIKSVGDKMLERAANPQTPIAELTKEKERLDELKARHQLIKDAHDQQEADERIRLQQQPNQGAMDPATAKLNARGEFYRAALSGRDTGVIVKNAYQYLGAIPEGDADLGGGEHLLPTTMGSEIVSEPFEENPMRSSITITNITGLELPKIDYTVDDDFITDKDTAKELELFGDTVVFGRNKLKIKAQVSDTVMRGTPIALQAYIDSALRSGLAAKEKKVMFNPAASESEKHMSFYGNGITEVEQPTMLDAILESYGLLGDAYKPRTKVAMRSIDWVRMIRDLSNGSAPLWGAKPEDIIGIPTIWVDAAVNPVVGDFKYAHLNYDLGTTYDTDKDVDKGIYKFVLTAWFDMQIKLKSAFRIAKVATTNP